VILSVLVLGYVAMLYWVSISWDPYFALRPLHWLYVLGVVADVVAGAALLTRRRWPVLLLCASMTAFCLPQTVVTVPIAFYTIVRQGRYRWAAVAAVAGFAGSVHQFQQVQYEGPTGPLFLMVNGFHFVVIGLVVPYMLAPTLAGVMVRIHRERVENLRTIAVQLQREQELVARNAVLAERSRIAREMHDVVTHYVGLIILRAGVLEVTAERGSNVGGSARLIGDLGRKAMQELRDLLQVLRTDEMAERPALSRAGEEPFEPDLARLLGTAQEAGMSVSWTVDPRVADCAASVRQGLYRIVQEALSNAGRHAPGAAIDVAATAEGDVLRLTVRNGRPGPSSGTGPAVVSGGLGLAGMRERARSLGGQMTAATTPQGDFLVQALIPLSGSH
jgi:signal transduction histidine kinase